MRRFIQSLSLLIPAAPAAAQTAPVLEGWTATPKIEAYTTAYGTTFKVNAAVHTVPNDAVALFGSWPGAAAPYKLVATAFAGPTGDLLLSAPLKLELLPADFELTLTAAVMHDGEILLAETKVPLGGMSGCEMLDFDFTLGQDEPIAGEPVDEQWADVGLHVSTFNNVAGHPDLGIIFDSASPTGGDTDLATPGYGPGNDTPLGQLLIVAENAVDADKDGMVDVPDDESGGGVIRFDFDEPWDLCSVTLVDIDDAAATELRFYTDVLGPADVLPVMNLGDNSVQAVEFAKFGVVRFEVALGGSGGVASLEAVPCPRRVDPDERSLGMPMALQTGETVTTQFADIGLTVEAVNSNPTHPDKALVFDTENPTGGDTDLVTPGYGFGNDTALGQALIISESDVDADFDGLVDNPDDEAAGGSLQFRFAMDVEILRATILDVDASEQGSFNLFDANDNLITSIPLQILGDNSAQTLSFTPPIPGVRRVELKLGGSGAITDLVFCPPDSSAP